MAKLYKKYNKVRAGFLNPEALALKLRPTKHSVAKNVKGQKKATTAFSQKLYDSQEGDYQRKDTIEPVHIIRLPKYEQQIRQQINDNFLINSEYGKQKYLQLLFNNGAFKDLLKEIDPYAQIQGILQFASIFYEVLHNPKLTLASTAQLIQQFVALGETLSNFTQTGNPAPLANGVENLYQELLNQKRAFAYESLQKQTEVNRFNMDPVLGLGNQKYVDINSGQKKGFRMAKPY